MKLIMKLLVCFCVVFSVLGSPVYAKEISLPVKVININCKKSITIIGEGPSLSRAIKFNLAPNEDKTFRVYVDGGLLGIYIPPLILCFSRLDPFLRAN